MGEDINDQIDESSRRLVEGGRELSAWEDLGGGNPRERRIEDLVEQLTRTAYRLDQEYRPVEKADKPIYKLAQAIQIIATVAGYHDPERFVHNTVLAQKTLSEATARNAAIRAHDSLGLLLNAFDFAIPSHQDIELDEAKLTQFTKEHAPSPFWEDPEFAELKDQLLQSIAGAQHLIGTLTQSNRDSIQIFVNRIKRAFIKEGTGWKIPRRGDRGYANYRNNLESASKVAWNEFAKESGSLLPQEDDHFF